MFEWLETHKLPCLFKACFGVICPGCGFQRSILYLLQGRVADSFYSWPALLPLLFFLCLMGLRISGMEKINNRMLKSVGFFCLITILISYLLKLITGNY